MEDSTKTLNEIREIITVYLAKICSGGTSPKLCEDGRSKSGREQIDQFVFNLMVKENYTVSDALLMYEKTFNHNLIAD